MDKKYTSLESTIRNVVRGSTGAAQDNKSLESKIRSVVLNEGMAGYTASSERTENGHRAIVRDSKGQTRYAGGSEYPTKRHAINGANVYIRNGGGQDGSDMERDYNKQVMFQTHVEEVGLEEARRKSAASLGFISTNAGHGVTASSEPYGYSHLPVVTTSSGKRIDVGHNPYPTPELAQQGAEEFIKNTYTRQGTDPVRGFSALAKHHRENAKIASSENMKKEGYIITPSGRSSLNEGSAKFAKIMARTAAARGEPITTDTTELEKKHNELLQTSRDAAARAKQARTDYETLAKKYGITPEPIGEEVEFEESLEKALPLLQYAPKILPEIGAGVKTIVKKLDHWSPPGFGAKVEKGAGSTELALPSPKTVTAPAKSPDISFQPPVAKTGTDVAIPGQPSMPKPNTKVDIPNAVGPTVTPPKIVTPKPTIFAKPKNVTEPVTKPGVSPKSGSVPKAGGAGRIAKGIGAADAAAEIADFLFGGSGGAAIPNNNDSAPAGDRIDLSRHRHYAKARQVYGQEIHYNEYEPDGDYIGENSAEQTDAQRSAIENVARPNSKNKLTKQAELKNKIIEDTQRRKAVILRAKEENKNGKDGANPDVETKPELKRVDVNEIVGSAGSVPASPPVVQKSLLRRSLGRLGGPAAIAGFAANDIAQGEDPERVALRTGLALGGDIAGRAAGGLVGGTLGSVAPVAGTITGAGIGQFVGGTGGGYLGDYVGGKLYDTGIYGKGKALAKGAVDTVSDAADTVSDTASSAYNKLKGAFSSPTLAGGGSNIGVPKSSTPAPAVSLAGGGGMIGQKPLAPSVPPKPTTNVGKVGGAVAGKAITKVAPKPALKLPGPGTPGYRTDAQMNDYEAKRAEMLNKYPNSVGAQSAGNRSVEAATKSLNTNTPVVAPQPSPGVNSTNTETPRSMGSSWNNSYKNKYSMGPGPSQFPTK